MNADVKLKEIFPGLHDNFGGYLNQGITLPKKWLNLKLTIILVSKSNSADSFIVEKIAEDIWLLEDDITFSFIDLFIKSNDVSPTRSINLATLGKIEGYRRFLLFSLLKRN